MALTRGIRDPLGTCSSFYLLCFWIVCSICILYALNFLIFLQPSGIVFLNSTIQDEVPEI